MSQEGAKPLEEEGSVDISDDSLGDEDGASSPEASLSDSSEDDTGEELLEEFRSFFALAQERSFSTPPSSRDTSFSSFTPVCCPHCVDLRRRLALVHIEKKSAKK